MLELPELLGELGFSLKILCLKTRVDIVDKTTDGVIGLRFEHRFSEYVFVIFSCYLPPEGVVRGHFSVTCWRSYIL